MPDKPYPWICGNCGQKAVRPVTEDYQTQYKHDGKLHNLTVKNLEVPTCQSCGQKSFSFEQDARITQALRDKVGLLSPAEIKSKRNQLGLNQEQLAECIGAAKESISRWETGALIQSVSTDRLLRMFFKHPTDPIWNNKWIKASEQTIAPKPDESPVAWITAASNAYATTHNSSCPFQEVMESVERRLLSRLLIEDSALPSVEARLREEDFQNVLMRFAYHSMRTVHRETGKIAPRRLAQSLARVSNLPVAADEIVILLVDSAVTHSEFSELLDLMSRRSELRRELGLHSTS